MRSYAAFALCLLLACGAARAAEPAPVFLWPGTAPGSENKSGAEQVRLYEGREHIVSNVHRPSLTPFLPDAANATGAAIVVLPGGGHRELWLDHEGYNVARWLAAHGIAAFVVKYRLAKEDGSTYTVEGTELADAQRAIRLVRSRAREWRLAPNRIGVMGFSAGGELATLAGTRFDAGDPHARDAVARQSSRPDFVALIYPGNPHAMAVPKNTPPTFLLCGENDNADLVKGLPEFYGALRQANVPAELHILGGAPHGFGLRESNPPAVAQWIDLLRLWLDARGFLSPVRSPH